MKLTVQLKVVGKHEDISPENNAQVCTLVVRNMTEVLGEALRIKVKRDDFGKVNVGDTLQLSHYDQAP